MMNRAYSILDIKSVDERERIIEGIASTPSTDRMGDIVESMGAKFSLPMPLLWQHRSSEPVGWVEMAQPTENGIPFRARIAKIEEAGELQNLTDKAWQATKAKLVRGVSIGFKIAKDGFETMKGGGWRIKDWEWLELSLVTIPANQDATISMVRSIDEALRTDKQQDDGAAGIKPKPIKIKESRVMPKTIQERLKEAETSLAAKATQAQSILDAADDKGETLDAEQDQQWVELKQQIDGLNKHIGRLRDMDQINIQRAVPVVANGPDAASQSRNGSGLSPIIVRHREVEKGIPLARYTLAKMAQAAGYGNAYELAKSREQWMAETPEVVEALRAPVPFGTTTDSVWAGPLVQYQVLSQNFAEFLYPMTIIGRIQGFTRVPFKVRVPVQTQGATVNWVGEGAPKPLTSLAFTTVTLDFAKIAGIIPLTEELVRAQFPERGNHRAGLAGVVNYQVHGCAIRGPNESGRRQFACVDHQRHHPGCTDRHHGSGIDQRHQHAVNFVPDEQSIAWERNVDHDATSRAANRIDPEFARATDVPGLEQRWRHARGHSGRRVGKHPLHDWFTGRRFADDLVAGERGAHG